MPMRTVDVKNASSGSGHSEVKCTAVFSELTGTEARNFSISRQAAYALLYLKKRATRAKSGPKCLLFFVIIANYGRMMEKYENLYFYIFAYRWHLR